MTTRHRGWRPWLAAVTAGLAGLGTLAPGRGSGGDSPAADPGLAGGRPAVARPALPDHQALPAAVLVRGPAPASAGPRRHGDRVLGPDATGGQIRLPGPEAGSAPATRDAVTAGHPGPGMSRPAWRVLLESRWQQRLATVTQLSLAYHDAADRTRGEHRASDPAAARQLRQLMRETVAARRALADTEEALARLPAGRFGRCEQCTAALPAAQLAQAPETRYCARCAHAPPGPGDPGALVVSAR